MARTATAVLLAGRDTEGRADTACGALATVAIAVICYLGLCYPVLLNCEAVLMPVHSRSRG